MGELTRLLEAARNGQTGAVDQIVVLTYQELRASRTSVLRRVPKITLLDTVVLKRLQAGYAEDPVPYLTAIF